MITMWGIDSRWMNSGLLLVTGDWSGVMIDEVALTHLTSWGEPMFCVFWEYAEVVAT